jgi:DNA-binding NtrC family response regulator
MRAKGEEEDNGLERAVLLPGEATALAATLNSVPSSRAPYPRPLQLVVLEPSGLSIYPLPTTGTVSIGRADDCDARLGDGLASRRHATLHLSPLALEDNGSQNGTRLGTRQLEPGALIEIQTEQAFSIGNSLLIVQKAKPLAKGAQRSVTPPAFAPGNSLIVRDSAMKQLYQLVLRLAKGQINVLILGETGVGKEVIAEAIHRASARSNAPFLRINCASLSEALLESELFGHERGSFTGAVSSKAGLFELASGGDVLLDEVGELSQPLQAKLLRVIETREVTRVGGLRARPVDVRFLFATNRNLEADVAQGTFRADLYFRLKGAALEIPPLRQRLAEILPLAESFVTRAAERLGLDAPPILDEQARASLIAHSWPGNVRELRNAIERAVLLCSDGTIRSEDFVHGASSPPPPEQAPALSAAELGARPTEPPNAESERERIAQALQACGGNQSRAAESLGMPRRTLVRRIAILGLPRPRGSA